MTRRASIMGVVRALEMTRATAWVQCMCRRWKAAGRCCAVWLRPHRGISHAKLPVSLGLFAFVHNVRTRGKAFLPALIAPLVTYDPGIP
jgi:hypothetical protein